MTRSDGKIIGGFVAFVVAVVVVAYVMEPKSSKENCIARGGQWVSEWKWCREIDSRTQCVNLCKSQGLAFKSYKNGAAIAQDEQCECHQPAGLEKGER